MQAFEATGTVDAQGYLSLDQPLEIAHLSKVRVIVLLSESNGASTNGNPKESSQAQDPSVQSCVKEPFIPASTPTSNNATVLKDIPFDPNATPIWELAAQITASVPDEEWAKLPSDLAQNFDYYQNLRDNS